MISLAKCRNAEPGASPPAAGTRCSSRRHTICPYSKATHGNIEVKLLANGKPVKSLVADGIASLGRRRRCDVAAVAADGLWRGRGRLRFGSR
ncbi:MAG TPA: hypothetical protein VHU84_04735 [Lacipirellulaceae bacterium]|jgi:hypothetical protein|nr:hypothetical protein [Lacipirellulaceae bacterium]